MHANHFPRQPKHGQSPKVVLLILGILFLLGLGVCGGLASLVGYGWSESAKEVHLRFGEHPQIIGQIGAVDRVSVSWAATLSNDDIEFEAYDMFGASGTGRLELLVPFELTADQMTIKSAVFVFEGRRTELDLNQVLDLEYE